MPSTPHSSSRLAESQHPWSCPAGFRVLGLGEIGSPFCVGTYHEDYGVLGSRLESPCSWKVPHGNRQHLEKDAFTWMSEVMRSSRVAAQDRVQFRGSLARHYDSGNRILYGNFPN